VTLNQTISIFCYIAKLTLQTEKRNHDKWFLS